MIEKFDPIYNRVVLRREKSALERKVEKANLITPQTIQDKYKSSEGVIVKCAPDCDDRVLALEGKKVLFARFSGDDIKLGDEEYVLATDDDIFGELRD